VHPSVEDIEAVLFEYWPAGHSWAVQEVFTPEIENVPIGHSVHPSELEVAFSLADYWPAGQFWF